MHRKIFLNYASQAWVAIMGVIFVPIYIRYLGAEAYGLIGFFTAISIFLHTLSMGIVPVLTREMTKIRDGEVQDAQDVLDLKKTFEYLSIFFAFLLIIVFYFLSDLIAIKWLNPDNLSTLVVSNSIKIMGIIISIRLIEAIYRSSLIGLGKIDSFAKVTAFFATLRGIGAIFVLHLTNGSILLFFAWNLTTTFLTICILRYLYYLEIKDINIFPKFGLNSLLNVKAFALGMMVVSLSSSIYVQVDKFILSSMMPLSEYGAYIIAANLAGLIFLTISPLTQAIFPELSKFYFDDNEKEFNNLFIWSVRLVTILSSILGATFVVFSKDILIIWTGNMDLMNGLVYIFITLSISSILNGLSWVPQQAQFSISKTNPTVKINSICSLLIVILIYPIYKNYGLLACSLLIMITNCIYFIYFMFITKKYFIKNNIIQFAFSNIFLILITSFLFMFLVRLVLENFMNIRNIFILLSLSIIFCSLILNSIFKIVSFNNIYKKIGWQ